MNTRRLVVPCALAALLLGACSGGDLESLEPVESTTSTQATPTQAPSSEPEPEESPAPEPEPGDEPSGDVLAEAGVDWPAVAPDDVDWAKLPAAPRGFTTADVRRLAEPLRSWATRAALDPAVWDGTARTSDVLSPIGPTARFAAAAAQRSVSPRLAVGNYFGDGVEVVGAPRMTSAWRTSVEASARGPVLRLWLQTRTAYEVEHDGDARVVGVIREHALGAQRGAAPNGLFSVAGWYEFGATGCPLVAQDALVPEEKDDAEALRQFVELGSDAQYASPRLGGDEQVDAAYAARCGVAVADRTSSVQK